MTCRLVTGLGCAATSWGSVGVGSACKLGVVPAEPYSQRRLFGSVFSVGAAEPWAPSKGSHPSLSPLHALAVTTAISAERQRPSTPVSSATRLKCTPTINMAGIHNVARRPFHFHLPHPSDQAIHVTAPRAAVLSSAIPA